jgi:hypothetical protein
VLHDGEHHSNRGGSNPELRWRRAVKNLEDEGTTKNVEHPRPGRPPSPTQRPAIHAMAPGVLCPAPIVCGSCCLFQRITSRSFLERLGEFDETDCLGHVIERKALAS